MSPSGFENVGPVRLHPNAVARLNITDRRPWLRAMMCWARCAQDRCLIVGSPWVANRTSSGTLSSALCLLVVLGPLLRYKALSTNAVPLPEVYAKDTLTYTFCFLPTVSCRRSSLLTCRIYGLTVALLACARPWVSLWVASTIKWVIHLCGSPTCLPDNLYTGLVREFDGFWQGLRTVDRLSGVR
jgi:hypothetical protein